MRYRTYVSSMIDRVFKLLPLREQADEDPAYLGVYLDDLAGEMAGALNIFPELCQVPVFVSAVSRLQDLSRRWMEIDFYSYRGAILKMTNALAAIVREDKEGTDGPLSS